MTILVAEDDPSILESLQDLLRLSGYEVLVAEDGEQALAALQAHGEAIRLIISDVTMPRLDGYQLLARVLDNPQWASIRFIFLTARGQTAEERPALAGTVCAYITKPFDADELLNIVALCLQ